MKPGVKYLLLALLSILLIVAAVFAYRHLTSAPTLPPKDDTASTDSETAGREPAQQNTAPDFAVTDNGGKEVRLSDYFGKPVLINFWATWCPPCRSELPAFDKLSERYGDKMAFMMIDMTDGYRETVETVKRFMADNSYTYPVFYDTKGDAAKAYHVSSIPCTVAIDRYGNVYKTQLGVMSESAIESIIKTLLEEK